MVVLRRSCAFAALCAALVGPAGAQTPTPAATPSATPAEAPTPSPAPTASPSPEPLDTPIPEGEIRVRSDRQGGEPGRYRYEGFVDFRAAQIRIQADVLDLLDEVRVDGTTAQKIVASGNVVFLSGDERLAGERLELDIDSGRGVFEKASGYLNPGVFIEADRIERVDPQTYRVVGTRFTACAQENPRWLFSASSATVKMNDKISARNVAVKVKGIPVFYIPYFAFPINDEQRSTGFLFPRFGWGNNRGIETGIGFFWAMGRSLDQTFSVDNYSDFGTGVGHEFRYRLSGSSRGEFRTYVLRPKGTDRREFDFDWVASQQLPKRFKASLNVRLYSDILNQQNLQDSLDYASTRTERAAFSVSGPLGPALLSLSADRYDTYFTSDGRTTTRLRRHLPQLRISQAPKKIGRTGIAVGFEAYAERLSQGENVITDTYTRYDFTPEITRPLVAPFLQLTPRAQFRYTRYGASLDETGALTGDPVVRQYLEGAIEMRGPSLFRIFNTPGNFYSEKFKHAIEPEAIYTYRSKVDAFGSVPSFDSYDQFPGTSQVLYGITNRLYAKRMGPHGREVTHEVLNWRVSQTYYFDISERQNQFDYNYYSAGFTRGEGDASHTSPIQSRLVFRPTQATSFNANLEYNLKARQIANFSLSTRIQSERLGLQGAWTRFFAVSTEVLERAATVDTVRGNGFLEIVRDRLRLEGGATYNVLQKRWLQSNAKLKYMIQCCGFAVENVRYNYNQRQDSSFKFQIELTGIGGITSLLGVDPSRQRNGGRY
jgi:lipopolysaccharide assembly outer membrane protein LptD (OstA)